MVPKKIETITISLDSATVFVFTTQTSYLREYNVAEIATSLVNNSRIPNISGS